MTTPRAKILLVDDDQEWAELVSDALASEGYAVETVPDGLAALERLPSFDPFVVVTDMQMPRMDGRQLLERLSAYDERLLVIVLSAERHREHDATLKGAFRVIEKPNAERDLVAAIAAAAEHRIERLPLQRLWRAAGAARREGARPRRLNGAGTTLRWGVALALALVSGVALGSRLRLSLRLA